LPLTWQEWVEFWQKDHEGKEHPHLLNDSMMQVRWQQEPLPTGTADPAGSDGAGARTGGKL
jgi:hypothetical protein